MKGYGQFCPIALAAEIVAERWTPLVLRELFFGSRRFNEIKRGVPLMSRSLLVTRLAALGTAGIVARRPPGERGGHPEYELTPAGRELQPVIEQLGVWGQRWIRAELRAEQCDAGLLMWNMSRGIHLDRLPPTRVVVLFEFLDAPASKRRFWLVLERTGVDLCVSPPGFPIDLTVSAEVRRLVEVWRGLVPLHLALRRGSIAMGGTAALRRAFPGWLKLSHYAHVERPSSRARAGGRLTTAPR